MSNFKKGDKVVQVLPAPIAGEVTGFSLCQETGEVHALVQYQDANGNPQTRHFRQDDLAAAPAAAPGA